MKNKKADKKPLDKNPQKVIITADEILAKLEHNWTDEENKNPANPQTH